MLAANAAFDQETLDSVLDSGHSRIPVHAGDDRHNIIGLVLVKDLLRHKTDEGIQVSDIKMRSIPRLAVGPTLVTSTGCFQRVSGSCPRPEA